MGLLCHIRMDTNNTHTQTHAYCQFLFLRLPFMWWHCLEICSDRPICRNCHNALRSNSIQRHSYTTTTKTRNILSPPWSVIWFVFVCCIRLYRMHSCKSLWIHNQFTHLYCCVYMHQQNQQNRWHRQWDDLWCHVNSKLTEPLIFRNVSYEGPTRKKLLLALYVQESICQICRRIAMLTPSKRHTHPDSFQFFSSRTRHTNAWRIWYRPMDWGPCGCRYSKRPSSRSSANTSAIGYFHAANRQPPPSKRPENAHLYAKLDKREIELLNKKQFQTPSTGTQQQHGRVASGGMYM